jgi:hypothetical protein
MRTKTITPMPRADELARWAVERANALAVSSASERATDAWAYEAASVGDVSALAALALLRA